MRNWICILAILILLALDWAALHDIVKGEPNLILEYAVLALATAGIGSLLIASFVNERCGQTQDPPYRNLSINHNI